MHPKKSEEGHWIELRELGEIGEKFIEKYLPAKGIEMMPLNLYTMADKSDKVMEWAELKKYPKIPDFIAKEKDIIFLFDVKTKKKYDHSAHNFLVNKRDYKHYLKFTEICPVKIYFLFVNHKNEVLALFVHSVEDRNYPETKEWDENIVYDVSSFKEQLE